MKAGLREVNKDCREKSVEEYRNEDALYDLDTYNAAPKEKIECLQSADRLDRDTHYVVDKNQAHPFAKTETDRQVTVLNKKEPVEITKLNQAQKNFNPLEHEADKITANLDVDQRASMRMSTAELKDNIKTAKKKN